MTATMETPVYLGRISGGGAMYRLEWSSDQESPTYDLYDLSGSGLLYHGTGTSYTVSIESGVTPVYWITDDSSSPPDSYPARVRIQWYAVDGVDYYRIDESVSGAWVERARIKHEGQWVYNWISRWLEDVTTHTFRMVAVGTDGNEATAVSLIPYLIRYPDPPLVDYTYSESTNTITISAA